MAVEYSEPVYYSNLFGKDVEVDWIVDTIYSTNDKHMRDCLLLELHQHLVFFPCPTLRLTLITLNTKFGSKPYEKPPTLDYMPQPGAKLENNIFNSRVFNQNKQEWIEIDMRLLQQWIRNNFLPRCLYKYSWFALWRFLNDKVLLKDTKITSFCKQMSDWFFDPNAQDPKKPEMNNVCSYNGYLDKTPYQQWNEETFQKNIRNKSQTLDGFNHLQKICYDLGSTWVPSRLKRQNQTNS